MNEPTPDRAGAAMSDTVADAWAEVIISIHERLEAEQAPPRENKDEATSPTDAEDRPCTA